MSRERYVYGVSRVDTFGKTRIEAYYNKRDASRYLRAVRVSCPDAKLYRLPLWYWREGGKSFGWDAPTFLISAECIG